MTVPIRRSIAAQLLRVVFALYLLVVLAVTAVQITGWYVSTKDAVRQELHSMEAVFTPSLEQALWEMNEEQVRGMVKVMVKNVKKELDD